MAENILTMIVFDFNHENWTMKNLMGSYLKHIQEDTNRSDSILPSSIVAGQKESPLWNFVPVNRILQCQGGKKHNAHFWWLCEEISSNFHRYNSFQVFVCGNQTLFNLTQIFEPKQHLLKCQRLTINMSTTTKAMFRKSSTLRRPSKLPLLTNDWGTHYIHYIRSRLYIIT